MINTEKDMAAEISKKMGMLPKMLGLTPDILAQVMEIFQTQQKKIGNCEKMLIALCQKQGIIFE